MSQLLRKPFCSPQTISIADCFGVYIIIDTSLSLGVLKDTFLSIMLRKD
ncbi:hypothetical protein GEOBRER4_n0757 [Citrifermentans bremense]|uniref:Uncharacterized protein n=1 Tax=Citrifermentans bremense TaxID=60035 RepID=A0A7R7IYH9_9BACT|nr:hypothetical protein GEOBRER4_n0757 [Citrifermentans bremense]